MSADKNKIMDGSFWIVASGQPIIEPKPKYFLRSGKERGAWFALAETVHFIDRAAMPLLTVVVCCEEGSYSLGSFGGN